MTQIKMHVFRLPGAGKPFAVIPRGAGIDWLLNEVVVKAVNNYLGSLLDVKKIVRRFGTVNFLAVDDLVISSEPFIIFYGIEENGEIQTLNMGASEEVEITVP